MCVSGIKCVCAYASVCEWSAHPHLRLSLNELVSSGGIRQRSCSAPTPNSQTAARGDCNKRESCSASLLRTGSGARIVQDTDNSEERSGKRKRKGGLRETSNSYSAVEMPHRGLHCCCCCCCRLRRRCLLRRCRDPSSLSASSSTTTTTSLACA